MRNEQNIFIGKTERRIQLGRSGRRREDNIKIDVKEMGCQGVDEIFLVQERGQWRALVNTVMILRFP
jgi:hypothetical protein